MPHRLVQQSKQIGKQVILAAAVFLSRLNLLPANVSPLGSFGFFGGNLFLYFGSIVLFDLLVKGLYPGFWLTYLGFASYPLVGFFARKHWKMQAALLPFASFAFFLLSNLGVWWYWYDHTWSQMLLCYTLALPFYQRTLLGDLVFGYGYLAVRSLHSHYGSRLLSPIQRLARA